MINLDKSENWSSWEDWMETKKAYYESKTGLHVYGGSLILTKINKKISYVERKLHMMSILLYR